MIYSTFRWNKHLAIVYQPEHNIVRGASLNMAISLWSEVHLKFGELNTWFRPRARVIWIIMPIPGDLRQD